MTKYDLITAVSSRKTISAEKFDLPSEYVRQMSEPEKAWLACAIDTDGCIGVGSAATHQLSLTFTSTKSLEILRYAKKITNVGHFTGPNWLVSGRKDILQILQQIEPYLIIKRELARVVIIFLNERIPKGRKSYDAKDKELWKRVQAQRMSTNDKI